MAWSVDMNGERTAPTEADPRRHQVESVPAVGHDAGLVRSGVAFRRQFGTVRKKSSAAGGDKDREVGPSPTSA